MTVPRVRVALAAPFVVLVRLAGYEEWAALEVTAAALVTAWARDRRRQRLR
jgi:hypothetical protein